MANATVRASMVHAHPTLACPLRRMATDGPAERAKKGWSTQRLPHGAPAPDSGVVDAWMKGGAAAAAAAAAGATCAGQPLHTAGAGQVRATVDQAEVDKFGAIGSGWWNLARSIPYCCEGVCHTHRQTRSRAGSPRKRGLRCMQVMPPRRTDSRPLCTTSGRHAEAAALIQLTSRR